MSTPTIPAPLAGPYSPPAYELPDLACDAHCHVFGPAARFPYAAGRAYTPPDAGFEGLSALHAALGLSRAVLVQASCHGTDNQAMVDAMSRSGGQYAGVAMVDETFTDRDLRSLHDAGVRGARFNFVQHLGGAPEMGSFWRIVDRVAALSWHIVLHFDAKDLPAYEATLARMPCPFIIDHMARVPVADGLDQEPFRALLEVMVDERAWVKISGTERLTGDGGRPPYDDVVPFARALVAAAPDRVLWGTDWPHPNVRSMPNDGDLVNVLAAFAPDAAVRHQILVTNPERLYEFGDR